MTSRFLATVVKEGRWYVAKCVEIDVASQGETIEQARDNLREALELYFEDDPPERGQLSGADRHA